jgi:hypothetical protein
VLTHNLDIKLAILTAAAAAIVFAFSALIRWNITFLVLSGLTFLSGVIYLVAKIPRSIPRLELTAKGKNSVYLLLNVLFFALMTVALITVNFRSDLYVTPIAYFLCLAVASAILAVEILIFAEAKKNPLFPLLKIIFLGVISIVTPQMIFPSLLGIDPTYHMKLTEAVVSTAHIPAGNYSSFPTMHLLSGITMIITNTDYKVAVIISACSLYVIVSVLFLFLLGREVLGLKVGLLSALFLVSAAFYVHFGWWMIPNSFAALLMLILIYVCLRSRNQFSIRLMALSIPLLATLVLTHHLMALNTVILLVVLWIGIQIYQKIRRTDDRPPLTFTIVALSGLVIFSWWLFASPYVVSNLKQLLFQESPGQYYSPTLASVQYVAAVPIWENIPRLFAVDSFWAIAFVGCFAAFSENWGNRNYFLITCGGIAFLFLGFITLIFPIGDIASRFELLSVFWLAIPGAVGFLIIYQLFKSDLGRSVVIFTLFALISFFSLTSPTANIDHPIWSTKTTVRYALKESEMTAIQSVKDIYNRKMGVDDYVINYYNSPAYLDHITNNLLSKNFGRFDGIIVIRNEIIEKPFMLPGIYKLDYDLGEILQDEGISLVYDCGTVNAFCGTQTAER